jgi:fatty acid synthase subunit beta
MASLFSGPTPTRPLVLHSSAARISIPVPASPLSAWVASEVLAQDFHDSRAGLDDEEPLPVEETEEGAVKPAPSNEPQDKVSVGDSAELAQVLFAAYERFNELFLSSLNVHSLVQSFEPEARAEVLTAYFKAFTVARAVLGNDKVKIAHASALLQAAKNGEAELYGLFGGQGVNEVSAELRPHHCIY